MRSTRTVLIAVASIALLAASPHAHAQTGAPAPAFSLLGFATTRGPGGGPPPDVVSPGGTLQACAPAEIDVFVRYAQLPVPAALSGHWTFESQAISDTDFPENQAAGVVWFFIAAPLPPGHYTFTLSVAQQPVVSGNVLLACAATPPAATLPSTPGQAPAPAGSVVYVPAGWNLLSFGNAASFSLSTTSSVSPTLYTFGPTDSDYRTTDLQHLQAGAGYWVYTPKQTVFRLTPSPETSVGLTLPAGKCAMIGNPSVNASARVSGASRVYVYTPLTDSYTQQTLLGIGRGAWACNDTTTDQAVTITDQGDVTPIQFPACCNPQPFAGTGDAELDVVDDSPYPLIAALQQVDLATNSNLAGVAPYGGQLRGCGTCPEYDPAQHAAQGCSAAATDAGSLDLPAGLYLVHLQSEGPSVPDTQGYLNLQPNTAYKLCFFVSSTHPQGNAAGPPAVPTGLRYTTLGPTSIQFDWDQGGPAVASYRVYDGQSGAFIASVGAATPAYTLRNLSPHTTYCVTVSAVNAAGESAQTAPLCATTSQ